MLSAALPPVFFLLLSPLFAVRGVFLVQGFRGAVFGIELRDDGRPIRTANGGDLIVRGAERGRCFAPLHPPVDRDGPGEATFRPRRRPSRALGGVRHVVGRAHLVPFAGAKPMVAAQTLPIPFL